MKPNDSALVYNTHPVVSELNRVPGFDPLRFLKKTAEGLKMELKYKKLWFRLKYPSGRIKLFTLKITDQLAIIEARVFFDKNDTEPKSVFTAQSEKASAPGGMYIEMAQHRAVDQALTDAGFGIQFVPDNAAPEVITPPVQPQVVPVVQEAPLVELPKKVAEEAAQSVAALVEEVPAVVIEETAAPVTSDSESVAAEETPVQTAPAEQGGGYTNEMSVAEICARMTLQEAEDYIVPLGTCNGQTMRQVADRRPASLDYYISGYRGDNNILRAAATIVGESRLQKAS